MFSEKIDSKRNSIRKQSKRKTIKTDLIYLKELKENLIEETSEKVFKAVEPCIEILEKYKK